MKPISKMITASAAALSTLALIAIATPAAYAGEFCVTNTSGMRGCGFATMEQCKASTSGIGGTCARDPFYSNVNAALAFQPKHIRSRNVHHAVKEPAEY